MVYTEYYLELKRLNRKLAALKHLVQDDSIEVMPQWVSFQNTHVCNLRCPHCQTHGTEEGRLRCNDKRLNMEERMLRRLAEESLPTADEFTLSLTGEPLTTPNFEKTLQELSQYGAKLDLITNGTLFTKERLALVIPLSKRIQISIDGATRLTFESIRLGADFRKVINKIKLLTMTMKLLPENLRPEIMLSYTIMGSNIRELPEIVSLASLLEVPIVNGAFVEVFYDYIKNEAVELHKSLYNAFYKEAMARAEDLGITIKLPPLFSGIEASKDSRSGGENMIIGELPSDYYESLTAPESQLDVQGLERDAKELAARIVGSPPPRGLGYEASWMKARIEEIKADFDRLVQKHKPALKEIAFETGTRVKYCDYLHRCAYIFPSGEVSPCCIVGSPVLGNIRFKSLREVWNGEAYGDFRRRFFSEDPFQCCKGCRYVDSLPYDVFIRDIFGDYQKDLARLQGLISKGFWSTETYVRSVRWELGCNLPPEDWMWLNRIGIFEVPSLATYAAPFPEKDLMAKTTAGLSDEREFAKHGVDIFHALVKASPVPITEFKSILDFGCGCGRLARMFKGHPYRVVGCDIDPGMVQWVDENLDYMTAVLTGPKPPLPFSDNEFDAIVSISVFTHLNEKNQDKFLWELSKITEEGGYLFITNHGSRALERAKNEEMIFKMLNIDKLSFERACHEFEKNQHAFIPQHKKYNLRPSLQDREKAKPPKGIGKRFREIAKRSQYRLWGAEEDFEYGITFIPGSYIVKHWAKWFDVIEIIQGAIHDFQDIIVLSPKKRKRKLLFLKG